MAEPIVWRGREVEAHASVCDMLRATARQFPDVPALRANGIELSYAHYDRLVDALARDLVRRNVGGKRVAVLLPNSVEMAIVHFAVLRAGATLAALNPDYTEYELEPILADTRPALLVCATDAPHRAIATMRLGGATTDWLRSLDTGDTTPLPALDPGAPALLQFTGGTTGRPKGVVLTHRAAATNVAQREAVLPTVPGDERVLCAMPLFHSFAVAMCLHLAANCGATLVILPRYRPDWLLEAVARKRITRLPIGPTILNGLLGFERLGDIDTSSVRCVYSGSAPLSRATLEAWEAVTGIPIYEGYGQSEAGPVLTYHGPEMPCKLASVGPPLPLTEIEIVDPIDGEKVLGIGEIGEIRARGPQIMSGYLDRPEETAEALREGWLYTGDIGRLDADGYLYVEDRKKEMVITGGYNVYPREVDEVLMQHGAVREAATIGIPDDYRGQVLRAYVVGGDEIALRRHCEERLVKYKRPQDYRFLESLPKTGVGKIDRQALREAADVA